MLLEVLGELADTLGPDGDLDFGRAGVALVHGIGFDNAGLLFLGDHGDVSPFRVILYPAAGKWGGKDAASAA